MPSRSERMEDEYEALYRNTGELIREWAEFELILAWPLAAMLGTDELRARVILGAIRSFDAKRRLILQLGATYADDDTNEFLTNVFKRAKALARNRNMLAHQLGGVAEKVNQCVFISDTDDPEIGTNFLSERTVDQASIKAWSKEAAALRGETMSMFSAGGQARVYASPKMHRRPSGDDSAKTTPPQPKAE